MITDSGVRRALLLAVLLVAWGSLRAQTFPPPGAGAPSQYPPVLPPRRGPTPPPLRFVRVAEIPLPGPLPGGPLRVEGEWVRVPLREGEAILPAVPEGPARAAPDRAPAGPIESGGWVEGLEGRYRFRTRPEGWVEAEKRCRRCRRGWRRSWRLRVGAATLSPPIVVGRRVCYAALDDLVYCVRASNGHRAWATDVGDRVSRPLALWSGVVGAAGSEPEVVQLLLVVPDGGEGLLGLDAYDGRQLAVHNVPASEGRLVSPAAIAAGNRIVVARQGYQESEAAVEILEIAPVEEAPTPRTAAAPYNGAPRKGLGRHRTHPYLEEPGPDPPAQRDRPSRRRVSWRRRRQRPRFEASIGRRCSRSTG